MVVEEVKYPAYRWVILFMGWLLFGLVLMNWYAVVPRAHDLIPGLDLTLAQFSLIVTAPTLAAIFLSIPGGILGDRFGIRRVIGLGGAICAVAGIMRMTASNFGAMFFCQLGIGAALALTFPSLPKMVSIAFPPREVGVATGLCLTGMGVGIAAILAIGAAFSTWQQSVLSVGIIMAVVTLLWLIFVRDAPARGKHVAERVRAIESLAYNFKQRNSWLIGIAQFLIMGAFTTITGSLPHMLVHVHEISPAIAGTISSVLIFAMVGGNVVGPVVSDRIGIRKPVFCVAMAVSAICVFFGWLTAINITTWVLFIIGGLSFGSGLSLILTFPVELPEIGQKWAGGCTGIILAMGNAGGFITMPYIFTPVAYTNPTLGYAIIALFIGAAILPMLIVPETGARSKAGSWT